MKHLAYSICRRNLGKDLYEIKHSSVNIHYEMLVKCQIISSWSLKNSRYNWDCMGDILWRTVTYGRTIVFAVALYNSNVFDIWGDGIHSVVRYCIVRSRKALKHRDWIRSLHTSHGLQYNSRWFCGNATETAAKMVKYRGYAVLWYGMTMHIIP